MHECFFLPFMFMFVSLTGSHVELFFFYLHLLLNFSENNQISVRH